ncbi:energy transducer TonB [Fulvivirgaceae bacterium BMA10]|uniref:Energy transducer TonB n=1 Tax=Splendidivirga corallicola TaxID=3051826 RepID=A0ABT8KS43_9BACT|nr:energy transducer TonB [Fulvivirgaceae bacterium BMA10]MDN5205717.1 energy transducer TonB [Fulvivirgaceae bacterium BMA10]
MEQKKNPKADLTRKSGLFMNLGLVMSLSFAILAFEWRSFDEGHLANLGDLSDNLDDLLEIPPTEQPPLPPPVIQQPEITIVEDDEEIEQEIEIDLDVEITEDAVIEDIIVADSEPEEEADEVFLFSEVQAAPKDGLKAFYRYVADNMNYPPQARRMGITGRVFLTFVVEKDGSLTDIKVLKGIGAGCDEEAVRVLASHPKWNPGKQRGVPVRVRSQISIHFQLR